MLVFNNSNNYKNNKRSDSYLFLCFFFFAENVNKTRTRMCESRKEKGKEVEKDRERTENGKGDSQLEKGCIEIENGKNTHKHKKNKRIRRWYHMSIAFLEWIGRFSFLFWRFFTELNFRLLARRSFVRSFVCSRNRLSLFSFMYLFILNFIDYYYHYKNVCCLIHSVKYFGFFFFVRFAHTQAHTVLSCNIVVTWILVDLFLLVGSTLPLHNALGTFTMNETDDQQHKTYW